jgi:hypothetical protein
VAGGQCEQTGNAMNVCAPIRMFGFVGVFLVCAQGNLNAGPFDADAPVIVQGAASGGGRTWRDSEFHDILDAANRAMPGEPQPQFHTDVAKKAPSIDGMGGFYDLLFLASVRRNRPGEDIQPRPGHSDRFFRRWGIDVLRSTGMMDLTWTWVEDGIRFHVEVRTVTDETESEPLLARIADAMHAAPRPNGAAVTPVTWQIIIGGIGALAVAAAGLATRARRKPPTQAKEEQKEPETAGYILQLSHNRLALRAGKPAQLQVAVWRVDSMGQYTLAADARIRLIAPRGVAVLPAEGLGRVASRIEQQNPDIDGDQRLTIEARAGGESYGSEVILTLAAEYQVEFF